MTLVEIKLLWCDAFNDDGIRCEEEIGYLPSSPSVRLAAKDAGWVRVDGKDFCPTHIPKHEADDV